GDGLRVGAVIGGGDRDHRVLGLRILAHRDVNERAKPEDQDQQADDDREDRLPDEGVGEVHGKTAALLFLWSRIRAIGRMHTILRPARDTPSYLGDPARHTALELDLPARDDLGPLLEPLQDRDLISPFRPGSDEALLHYEC